MDLQMEASVAEAKQVTLPTVAIVPLLSETVHPSHPKKPFLLLPSQQSSVPPETVKYLTAWMMSPEHVDHPYPDEQEKAQMVRDTGIDIKQLSNWFSNTRRRFWKPWMEGNLTAHPTIQNADTVTTKNHHHSPHVDPVPVPMVGLPTKQQPRSLNCKPAKTAGPSAKKGRREQEKKLDKKISRRKTSGNLRLPGRKTKIHIIDDEPDRLTNPLIDVPKADSDHPNAAELYVWSDIAFHRQDTYPMSYYARVLGFDVPPPPLEDTNVLLDPAKMTIRKDDACMIIPPLGSFADVWKQEGGDGILDYHDPMYQIICQQGLKPDLIKQAVIPPAPRSLSQECLAMAKELLFDLPDIHIMDIGGDFGMCTTQHNSISYQLVWYQILEEQHASAISKANYGIPSATHTLKKQKVSELIIFINCYRSGVAPSSLGKKNEPVTNEEPLTKDGTEGCVSTIDVEDAARDSQIQERSTDHPANVCVVSITSATQHVAEAMARVDNNEATFVEDCIAVMTAEGCITRNDDPKLPKERVLQDKEGDVSPLGMTPVGRDKNKCVFEQPTSAVPNHVGAMNDQNIIALTALALEHARVCDVWYGLLQVPRDVASVLVTYFRMVQLAEENNLVTLVCDLKKCSYKYAFLLFKNPKANKITPAAPLSKERMLVRLPNVEDATFSLHGSPKVPKKSITRPKRTNIFFTGVGPTLQKIAFGIRLHSLDGSIRCLDSDGNICDEAFDIQRVIREPSWDVLKLFTIPIPAKISEGDPDDTIFSLLRKMQNELVDIESVVEFKVRSLLGHVLDERNQFESEANKRADQKRVLDEYQSIIDRRKEIDMAWQSQRDQDMDAVCEICNDGEVTPDNQILFCEACNVAVHQICYGIERVPEGDYYCITCRYFERKNMGTIVSEQPEKGTNVKLSPSPLPIYCELCPLKQGAFIRTDTSTHRPENVSNRVLSRWVHVLCAKWQGLNFVNDQNNECVEDILPLKVHFQVLNASCMLCQSNRGAFNKCRDPGCDKYLHVSCARSSGLCEVVHGENCVGPVDSNPWSLLCTDHSGSDPTYIPHGTMNVDQLIMAAIEFPTEKIELPTPKASVAFHKMLGNERKVAMQDRRFEEELVEILMRKNQGVRCESCFQYEEDGKNLTRCMSCSVVFCDSCTSDGDGISLTNRNYKCPACAFVDEHKSADEWCDTPRCSLCVQKGGWLRQASAAPMKMSVWKTKKEKIKEWPKTLFAKPFWCHQLCQMWQQRVYLDPNTLICNCNDVVMTHGRGFINEKHTCELCGSKDGMKIQCTEPCCRGWGELRKPPSFHATCARQAGLEVENRPREDGYGYDFYVKCFRHGSNMFNLRARLEDLIEIEKRRSGKVLESKDTKTMSFVHASRLLNTSILVLHTLGWAWRWAEWWVLYRDSWEPLLEPGQMEEEMTNEEKRIVESTPESRCEDARKCRLAALAVALRNRSFDDVEDGDTVMLDRALRAMLHTKSLVGPLEEWEIDFFAEWLGIAYRSKSRLLGFAEHKVEIKLSRGCVLEGPENTPKFELGSRRLPGAQVLPIGEVFESDFNDADDFLKPEKLKDGTLVTSDMLNSKQIPQKLPTKRKADSTEPSQPVLASPRKRVRSAKSNDMGNAMSFEDVKSENSFESHSNLQLDLETAPETAPESEIKQEKFSVLKELSGKKRGRPPPKSVSNSAPTPDNTISGVSPSTVTGPKRGRPSKEKSNFDALNESSDDKSAEVGATQCAGRISEALKFEGSKPGQQKSSSTVINEPEFVKRKAGRPRAIPFQALKLDGSSEDPGVVAQPFKMAGTEDKQEAGGASKSDAVFNRTAGHRKSEPTRIVGQDESTIGMVPQPDERCPKPATTPVFSEYLPPDNTGVEEFQAGVPKVQASNNGGGKSIVDLNFGQQMIKVERGKSSPIRFAIEDLEYDEDLEQ